MTARPMPTASVIVCCYSDVRFDDLCQSLNSILSQSGPDDTVLAVVDHNERLMARVEAAFPDVRVVANGGPRGLSGARNAGIAASTGALVIFLDDDAEAEPEMMATMKRVVAEDDGVVGVAGHVEPDWIGGRPAWFPSEFLWVVGCTYQGLEPGPVRNVIGAAMAVRRLAFDTVGGFVDGLGRGESNLPLGCEETEFCIRATGRMAGTQFVYVTDASCRHKVPASRVTMRYLAKRCYAEGISKASLSAHAITADKLTTERRYVTTVLPRGVARGIQDGLLRLDPYGLARAFAIVLGLGCTVTGYLVGTAIQGARRRQGVAVADGLMKPPIVGRSGT